MKKLSSFLKTILWMAICVTSLTSCFTTATGTRTDTLTIDDFPAFRDQCIGQTHNQIVTKLGAPQRQVTDGAGGTILIYENTTTSTVSSSLASAYNINFFTRTYTPGMQTTSQQVTTTDYVHYFVNADNICYEVKTNIPMTHTEQSAPYEYEYKKIKWGKSIALVLGVPILVGVTIGVILGILGV